MVIRVQLIIIISPAFDVMNLPTSAPSPYNIVRSIVKCRANRMSGISRVTLVDWVVDLNVTQLLCMSVPLWSSGQCSWLQIQRSGFDSRRYHIFFEVVGLERGPRSLVSTTEELLERKCSGSGLESREYGRRNPSR
jgi:hypothetical protein